MSGKKVLITAFLIISILMNSASTVLGATVETLEEYADTENTENAELVENEEQNENTEISDVLSEKDDDEIVEVISDEEEKAENVSNEEILEDNEKEEETQENINEDISINSNEVINEDLTSKENDTFSEGEKTNSTEGNEAVEHLLSLPVFKAGKLKENYTSAKGNEYVVTVNYGVESKIPDGSRLKIKEFDETSYEYQNAKNAVLADKEKKGDIDSLDTLNIVALDISIIDEQGQVIEPETAVSVEIRIKSMEGVEDLNEMAESLEIQHHEKTKHGIVIDNVDSIENVKENKYIDSKFSIDSFSTFTITWNNRRKSVNFLYGYMENNRFVELTEKQEEDFDASSVNSNQDKFLIYDFEGYTYESTHIDSPTGTSITPLIRKGGNEYYYYAYNRWNSFVNGNSGSRDVYILYKAKDTVKSGGSAKPNENQNELEAPKVEKTSKDNKDGTRTISLSITGKTEDIVTDKLADVIVVFDVSGSMDERINGQKKLSIAKTAVNSMAQDLLSKNTNGKELIRMSLISFSTTANTVTNGFVTKYSDFSSAVNGLSASGGTNWEQALRLANEMEVESDRSTFIIFVSDGDPTFRESRMSANGKDILDSNLDMFTGETYTYYRNNSVFGEGTGDSNGRNFNAAVNQASSIIHHNKTFYTIAFGQSGITKMGNLQKQSEGSLEKNFEATDSEALTNALNTIKNQIQGTIGWNAIIEDGVTDLTNLNAKVYTNVDPNSFTYSYTKNGANYTLPEGTTIEPATYENGEVKWDLGRNYQLEDGVTYTVSFIVWPSQDSIDYVTQLNNGEIEYDDLDKEVRDQIEEKISEDGSKSYYLNTNTYLKRTYQKTTQIGDTVTPEGQSITDDVEYDVDPLDLYTMKLNIEKIFTDTLTAGEDREKEVTLVLQQKVANDENADWEDVLDDDNKVVKLVLNDENNWKDSVFISPGLIANGITYNPGYKYRVAEPDINYHYELNSEVLNPMHVGTKDVGVEEKYFDDDGNETNNDATVTAENIVKGGINISKVVVDQDKNEIKDSDVEFTIKGKILDSSGNPYTWQDGDDVNNSGAYHKYDANGNQIIHKGHFASTDNIEFTLKAGEYVRFINVPKGSTYEFYEDTSILGNNGYSFEKIEGKNQYRKVAKGEFFDYEIQPTVANNVVTGTVYGNVEHNVKITNKTTSIDINATKAWKNADNTTIAPEGATVQMTLYKGEVATDKVITLDGKIDVYDEDAGVPAYGELQEWVASFNNLPKYDAQGNEINYRIVETKGWAGYKADSQSVTSGNTITNIQEKTSVKVLKQWEDANNQDGIRPESVEVILLADDKAYGDPVVLSNSNSWTHTWENLPKFNGENEISYSIAEVKAHDKYTSKIENEKDQDGNDIENSYKVINTHTPDIAEVNVTKKWFDEDNIDNSRPNSIKVQLLADGENYGDAITLNSANDWYYEWTGLPKNSSGKEISYTVVEVGAENSTTILFDGFDYTVSITGTSSDGYLISNTHKPLSADITLTGTKKIDGRRMELGDIFEFTLTEVDQNGNPLENAYTETVRNSVDVDNNYGKIDFSKINYQVPDVGKHYYKIVEKQTLISGITASSTEYIVTVDVSVITNPETSKKELKATLSDNANGIEFINKYEATGNVTFAGSKTIDGRGMTADDKYTFTVTEKKDGEDKVVATGANNGTETITFTQIDYTLADVGTHTYTVTEDATQIGGIQENKTTYEVTVEVSDVGDGTLSVKASDNAKALEYVNKYEATGNVTFAGSKTIDGRGMTADDKYTFTVTEKKDGEDKVVATGANNGTETITFTQIDYTLADVGTHTYTVTEDATQIGGIQENKTTYEVTVEVSDVGDGTLSVKASDNAKALEYVNKYEATGNVTFAGSKTIDGRGMTADDKYTFTVTEKKDGEDKVVATGANNGTETITFTQIDYTLADVGTHTYTVTEDATQIGGIQENKTTYEVTVEVSDKGDGTLSVKASDNAKALEYVNKYEATGNVTFAGSKTIDGRGMTADDKYTFTVTEKKDGEDKVVATGANNGTETITFTQIDYTLADVGTHTYTVTEDATQIGGIQENKTTYEVTVEVSDVGDGTLSVKASDNAKALEYVNKYEATGNVTFAGSKTIDGRGMTADDKYTFTVTEKKDGEDKVVATGANNGTETITFTQIDYTLADVGTHTYTVTEDATQIGGIQENKTTYEVTVEVSDVGDGTLSVKASDNAKALEYVNKYEATGNVTFAGSKTIDGRGMTADDKYTFTVTEKKDGEDKVVATGANNGTETITFTQIDYTLADVGTHTYTVTEDATQIGGIQENKTTYEVTVEVSDVGDGTLSVKASDNAKALEYVNKYEATGNVTFAGSKTIDGRGMTADDKYTFTVTEKKDGEDKVVATGANNGTETITFTQIDYTLADVGTHTYTVTEDATQIGGIQENKTTYEVTVEVSDVGDGTLSVKASDNAKALEYVNKYEATGNVTFAGSKTIDGRGMTADDKYTFTVTEKKDGEDKVVATGANNGTETITFTQIDYTLADVGTHTYTVTEDATQIGGIQENKTTYEVTVEVSDVGDGTLSVKASDNAKALEYVNKYEATGNVTFAGSKTIDGRGMTADDKYTFTVTEKKDGEDKVVATGANNGTETITFTQIDYTLADVGTHTYTVTEDATQIGGIQENKTTYEVTVEVSDVGDGTLSVKASDNATALDFTNIYKANGNVEFEATKVLVGRDLEANQFKFELKDIEENSIEITTNDAKGNIKFKALEYTEQDAGKTYTYTIKEIDEGIDGYVYDQMVIEILVTISDNGDGTLNIDTKYSEDTEFNNEYQTVDVNVKKIWDDSNNQDGIRPESINVTLYSNGEKSSTVELSKENDWSYTWANMVKHSGKVDIVYTVEEDEVEGYEASIITDIDDDSGNATITITNTHQTEKADIKVLKKWEDADNHDNIRPESIKVQLYANGVTFGDAVTLDDSNEWTYIWRELSKNDSGEEIKYTVKEIEVPEKYYVEYSVSEDGTLLITNTQIPGEGGYEEPPVEVVKIVEPHNDNNNPNTGISIFDNYKFYILLLLGTLAWVIIETKKSYKNR